MPRRHTRRVKRAGALNNRERALVHEPDPPSSIPTPEQLIMARQRMDPNLRQNLRETIGRLNRISAPERTPSNIFSAAMAAPPALPGAVGALPSRSPVLRRMPADGASPSPVRALDFSGTGRKHSKSKKQSHRRRGRHTRRR